MKGASDDELDKIEDSYDKLLDELNERIADYIDEVVFGLHPKLETR